MSIPARPHPLIGALLLLFGLALAIGGLQLSLLVGLALPMGVPYTTGTITTRSGLIFAAGTQDRFIRAIDLLSGTELWRDYLPGTARATPMTFVSPASGCQFVVIAAGRKSPLIAGGHRPADTHSTSRGYIVAYAINAT